MTADKNIAALRGLIAKANEVTGGNSTTVTSAVNALIDGFGQGGGEDNGLALMNNTMTVIPDAWKDLTQIAQYGFYAKFNLTEIDFPNVRSVGGMAFAGIRNNAPMKYTRVNLPEVTTIGDSSFQMFSDKLETLFLPKLLQVPKGAFGFMWGLKYLILPSVTAFTGIQSVYEATKCALVLPGGNIPTLVANDNWFHVAKICVPANLLDQYRTATNWTALEAKMSAIEDNDDVLQKLAEVGCAYTPTTIEEV